MIDPIVIDEEVQRITQQEQAIRRRREEGFALKWFSDHALSKPHGPPRVPTTGVLPESILPVAHATPLVESIKPYLNKAFREHHRSIIERAIFLAQKDFDNDAG